LAVYQNIENKKYRNQKITIRDCRVIFCFYIISILIHHPKEMIIIDSRECKLIQCLKELNTDFSIEQMTIGDIQIGNEWILERKTITDLHSSLVDGRFNDQRQRLRGIDNMKIGYIVEGNPPNDNALLSALASLSMEFYMFISASPHTTALQILKIARGKSEKCDRVTVKKCQPTSPVLYLEAILQLVPGVGKDAAENISKRYSSVVSFIKSNCDISEIRHSSERKISKSIQQKIRILFGTAATTTTTTTTAATSSKSF